MTQIDDVQLREIARKIARTTHRTNSACVYSEDGEPVCIVGYILHDLGVTIDYLDTLENGIDVIYASKSARLGWDELPDVTDRGVVYLTALQRIQDSSDAIDFAELVDMVPLPDMPKANYDIEDLVDRVIEHGVQLRHGLQHSPS